MNRSTPSRAARAERMERASPYARPTEPKMKRSSSLISFPGIRSLVSYITHPFARSPSSRGLPMTKDDIDVDQKSESGSEDGWNGEPEQQMMQGDVFEEEEAARKVSEEKLRAGEKPGGRRDTARKELLLTAGTVEAPLKSPVMPGHLVPTAFGVSTQASSGPSGPTLGNTVTTLANNLKRRLSPTKHERPLPIRSPLPVFPPTTPALPAKTASTPQPHTSASSVALQAFMDAKNGQPLTPDDLKVIDSLTNIARQETGAGTPARVEVGGWAAGNYSPRPIKNLPSSFTPTRPAGSAFATPGLAPATPGNGFSVGVSPAGAATPGQFRTPGSVRYIGPGWSAKRLYPQAKSNLRPLLQFNIGDEGIAKKRKIEEFEIGASEDIPPVPSLPTSISMPNFASSSSSRTATSNFNRFAETTISSTPISKPSPKADPVSVGKRRAADIMLDLINAEMAETANTESPPPFIVNPYHPDAYTLVSAGGKGTPSSAPGTPIRNGNGTPRKSILKGGSGSQTPLRGAAKRLEEAKNAAPTPRKMTALEMLVQRSPAPAPVSGGNDKRSEKDAGKNKGKGKATVDRSEMVTTEEDETDIEMVQTDSARAVDLAIGAPAKRVRMADPVEEPQPEPEPFKPFTAPQLSSTSIPIPSSPSTSSPTPSRSTSSNSSFGTTPSSGLKPAPAAKFTPSPLSNSIMPEEPKFSFGTSTPSNNGADKLSVKDFTSIYLSAKDTALAIAKDALPFFTFFIDLPSSTESEGTKRAKEEALKRSLAEFAFSLDRPTSAKPLTTSAPAPVPASVSSSAGGGFNWAAATGGAKPTNKAGGEGAWKCGDCDCMSPATAAKCIVCDVARPGLKVAEEPVAKPAPAPATGMGFNWAAATGGSKPAGMGGDAGMWKCGICDCKSPESASKCTVCDGPRV